MKITLTGGSGFIGRQLIHRLVAAGHTVHTLGRSSPAADVVHHRWDAVAGEPPPEALEGSGAVVHLAGEPVAAHRWNPEVKRRIYESRVLGTRHLVHALSTLRERPQLLISASAIGYYGNTGEDAVDESARPAQTFLGQTCVDWEREAVLAEALGIRVVRPRIGIVFGREGGALAEMARPFRMGAGGHLGSGKQWMSWIHLEDMVRMLEWLVASPTVSGAVNATSPNPVRNMDFTHEFGHALHRPSALGVPRFALKLMMGEMAEFMLESQRVVPVAALRAGFEFRFPDVRRALADIYPRGHV